MFADLNEKLTGVFRKMRGQARISEANIADALKQVRMALLEADVNYKVVKSFIADVEAKALGEAVIKSVSPAQQFIKIVNDSLIEILGGSDYKPNVALSSNPPTIIMLAGLQGSGKTTSAGKLARYFLKSGKSVLLVACDIYRPAAIDQLEILGKSLADKTSNNIDVYVDRNNKNAVKIATDSIDYARKTARDVVIIDTAGRLHIDNELMKEVADIKKAVSPHYIFFVTDAMAGQDAVNVASEFNKQLEVSGLILSKVDGDARGGVALSVKYVTGKPIVFMGSGEKVEDFELFHPDRLASRILGMGDIVSLVEKAGEALEEDEAKAMVGKLKTGFDYNDLLSQFAMMDKMGSLESIFKFIPGLSSKVANANLDLSRINRVKAIIYSMTKQERSLKHPLNSSRKKRIASGAGVNVSEINRLIDQLSSMNKMVKKLGKNMGNNPMGSLKAMREMQSMMKNIGF